MDPEIRLRLALISPHEVVASKVSAFICVICGSIIKRLGERIFASRDDFGQLKYSSQSQLDDVRAYIGSQPEHHRTKTFVEEYRAFLVRHHIEYDERYLLG